MNLFEMSQNDMISLFFFLAFCIYIYNTVWKVGNKGNIIQNKDNTLNTPKKTKDIQELKEKKRKEELQLESLKIKYEEISEEIETLNFESSTDLEKENKNSIKVRKLKLQLAHIEDSVVRKITTIEMIRRDIEELN